MRHFFLIGLLALCSGCWESRFVDEKMIAQQREHERLEREVFTRLVFTLTDRKMPGNNYQLVVRDQLGQEWMFKTSSNGRANYGEVVIYNHYRMFGVATPEVHVKDFVINGHRVTGTLQRLVPNLGGLTEPHLRQMAPTGLMSLAKLHALSWLSANYHVHPRQFLVIGENNKPIDALRIDNSVEWFLIGNDRLAIDYQSPVLWTTPQVGYARFWRLFLNDHFNLSTENILAWIRLIRDFPDKIYSEPFQLGPHKFDSLANNFLTPNSAQYKAYVPEVQPKVDQKTLIRALLNRKKRFHTDMNQFYKNLLESKDQSLPKVANADLKTVANEITKFHHAAIETLRDTTRRLDSMENPQRQQELEPKVSFLAYRALRSISISNTMSGKRRAQAINHSIKKLKKIQSSADRANDRNSAAIALENIDRLLSIYKKQQKEDPTQDTLWIRQEFMQLNDLLTQNVPKGDRAEKVRRR